MIPATDETSYQQISTYVETMHRKGGMTHRSNIANQVPRLVHEWRREQRVRVAQQRTDSTNGLGVQKTDHRSEDTSQVGQKTAKIDLALLELQMASLDVSREAHELMRNWVGSWSRNGDGDRGGIRSWVGESQRNESDGSEDG